MRAENRPLAVVTGASSGIGEAFAEALAARDYDLLLLARSQARLQSLADRLHEKHGIDARVHCADLSKKPELESAEAEIRRASPQLLVNNAGFGTAGRFQDLDLERESDLVGVNILALLRLTHAALPAMLERGSGDIINVSSLAGEVPSGFNATYGASKAFVTSFSRALAEELSESPVGVQCLLPGLTRTQWAEKAGIDTRNTPNLAFSEPAEVVAASLRCLAAQRVLCIPGASNRLLAFFQRALPRRWMSRMTAKATRGSLIDPA